MKKIVIAAALFPLLCASQPLLGEIAVVDTIFLAPGAGNGIGPSDVAVNSQTHKVYTANHIVSYNVSVIDVNGDSVIKTIKVGDGPFELCVNDSTNRIYVTNQYGNSVSVIDGETDSVMASIPVANDPWGICVNRSTNYVYVTHGLAGTPFLYIIDGNSNTVVDSIAVGSSPRGVCVNDSTNMVYVARLQGWVYVIDGTAHSLVDSIQTPGPIYQVEASKKRNRVYASNFNWGLLYVIDCETNTVIDSIPVPEYPYGICVNDSADFIYVTSTLHGRTVTIIDASTNTVVDTLVADCALQGIDLHPSLNRIYFAGQAGHWVGVIDGGSNTLDTVITVGILPFHISGNPLTDHAYVTDLAFGFAPGRFLVLDTAGDSVVREIGGIDYPYQMAVDPVSNLLWVTSDTDFVYIVDGGTNSVTDSIDIGNPSWGICRNDSLNRIYVTYQDRLFFLESDSLVDTLRFGNRLEAVDVDESTGRVYVTDTEGDSLYVVDGEACSLVTALGVGEDPYNVWVNSSTNLIYVSNWESRDITVVDGGTNTVMGSILLPYPPDGITGSEGANRIYVADSNAVFVIDGFTNLVVDSVVFGTLSAKEWFDPETGRLYVTDIWDGWVYVLQDAVGVDETAEARGKMSEVRLMQNYPNPFSRTTTIHYTIPSAVGGQRTAVNLSVYDLSGRLVKTLVDQSLPTAYFSLPTSVVWDGRDMSGNEVASGVYFYRLSAGPPKRQPATPATKTADRHTADKRTSGQKGKSAEVFSSVRKMVLLR